MRRGNRAGEALSWLAGVQLDCVEELVMASVPLSSSGVPLRAVVAGLWSLTKPRVVALIVFCAAIGYVLAVPGWPAAGMAPTPSRLR